MSISPTIGNSLRGAFTMLIGLSSSGCLELLPSELLDVDAADALTVDSGFADGTTADSAAVADAGPVADATPDDVGASDQGPHDTGPSDQGVTFVPLNRIDPLWAADAKRDLRPTTDIVINTDLRTIDEVSYLADSYVIGPYQCAGLDRSTTVFALRTIDIPADVTVDIRGRNAVALLAAGPISIRGLIDVSGGRRACETNESWCAGPGGWPGGLTGNPPFAGVGPGRGAAGAAFGGPGSETGGGGGGHGSTGGRGGNDTDGSRRGGTGGPSYNGTTPLCGGSGGGGGGAGAPGGSVGQNGGGGGGAVHLVSFDRIVIDGVGSGINAGGGPGLGDDVFECDDGGGGGGSGGSIVLEAPTVFIGRSSVLAANGGGGGGAGLGGPNPCSSDDGRPGGLDAQRAAGGAGGGSGGALGAPQGGDADDRTDGTGGGGGAAGRIRVQTAGGRGFTLDGVVSPAADSRAHD